MVKENGIDIFSITDHDNADSIRAMQDVDIKGLIYIPGIEFSASKAGYKMHILGYNVDGNSQELLEACRNMKMRKYDLHIHSKFSDGDYTLEEIVE